MTDDNPTEWTGTQDRRRFRVSISFLARAMLVVVLVWALANAAWLTRDILFIGFLAVLLALFLSIFVDWLEPYLPRWLATILVFLLWLASLFAFFLLAWPSLQGQIVTIREEVPRIVDDVAAWVQTQVRALAPGDGGRPTEEFTRQVNERMGTEAARIVGGALPLLNTVIGALSGILIVVVAGVFLAVHPRTYLDGFIGLLPHRSRDRVRDALVEVGTTLRRWIAGMSISMVIILVLTTTGLWLLDVPAFLALGMIAGLLVFIPFIGPILAAIPAMALALTVSPVMMLWVGLLYLGIQLLESNALTPIVMKRAVQLQPALLLLFQMSMGVLFGFLGLLVAVPLLAAINVLVQRLYVDRLEEAEE
ncbi:MAG TPA: AI-2E family transporter [Longimicrobiales bacterium]|nr:AI-2E family transporter [Longimicrobiales bacterium]